MRLALTLTHFFYPQESNNHKARILHNAWLAILLTTVVLFQSLLYLASSPGVKILGYAANISPQEVISLTNAKRAGEGLNTLQYSEVLSQAAQEKGNDMLEHDYWAHISPSGVEPWGFFKSVGYQYKYAGENLARDFSSPNSAIEAWMASPTHRDNMLSDRYQEIGVAVVEGDLNGVDTTIIVQLFGTKMASSPSVPVASARTPTAPLPKPTPSSAKMASLPSFSREAIVTGADTSGSGRVSPLFVTKVFSMILAVMLISALVVDGYIVTRNQVTRVAGRAFAHISFMGMVLAIILIIRAGQIL